jgi:hypothetical protein
VLCILRDVYIDATDQFNTHLPYFEAASFHLDEKTYYRGGEMLWSGDTALIGRGLSMEGVVIVTDDGYVRSRCHDLNLEVSGSLGILLDGVEEGIATSEEAIQYLDAIEEGSGRFNQGLLNRSGVIFRILHEARLPYPSERGTNIQAPNLKGRYDQRRHRCRLVSGPEPWRLRRGP